MTTPTHRPNEDSPRGLAFAITAYLLWGFLPLYMHAMADIPPPEIIAHRIIWSVPVAGAVLIALGRTADLRAAIRNPRMLGMAAVTATLITVNWGIYVWAIVSGHALDAALGYYINPLFSVFLGAVLLRERLKPIQIAAIALVALAVAILTVEAGHLPLVALGLTVTWGAYAFLKKQLPIGPNQGFFLEVALCGLAGGDRAEPPAWHRHRRYPAAGRLRADHGGAADDLCQWRQAFAAVDHRHPAIHRADDDLPDRGVPVRRAVRAGADDRLSDDLGGAGDLYRVHAAPGASAGRAGLE